MSADLFAQFGPFSGSNTAQSSASAVNKQQPPQSTLDDPFAFLNTTTHQRQEERPPPSHVQSQAWGTVGTPTTTASQSASLASVGWDADAWTGPAPAAAAPTGISVANVRGHDGDGDDDDDDDDAWGDFEAASQAQSAPPDPPQLPAQQQPQPAAPIDWTSTWAQQPPPRPQPQPQPQFLAKTRLRAPTMDLMTNTLISLGDAASPAPSSDPSQPSARPLSTGAAAKQPTRQADPNVLFDAQDYDDAGFLGSDDDDDDDDDFGDFEVGQAPSALPLPASGPPAATSAPPAPAPAPAPAKSTTSAASATALVDLLSLGDPEPPLEPSLAPLPSVYSPQSSSTSRKPPPSQLLNVLSFGSVAAGGAADVMSASNSYPQPPKSPSFRERNPFPGLTVTTPVSAEFPKDVVDQRSPSPVTVWPTFEPPPATVAKSTTIAGGAPTGAQPPLLDDWDAWDAADAAAAEDAAIHRAASRGSKAEPVKVASVSGAGTDADAPANAADDWGWDAEDPEPQRAATSAAAVDLPVAITQHSVAAEAADRKSSSAKAAHNNASASPPTNVPPPSILLSLFPTLLALPEEALFRPTAGQPADVRQRILTDPRTVAFLRDFLQLAVVAARVIAGRKQRWHRDKFLAQSMSIAAIGGTAGGSGRRAGMKLAGIDKSQGQREDREAADVVAVWSRLVGKLRSAVATANAAIAAATNDSAHSDLQPSAGAALRPLRNQQPLKIPELQSTTIPVATAKMVPTAPRACVVCGLRRDERVRGVDGDVQDVFGEWWVEHWGHRACRNFWVEHEATLRSR